MQILDLKIHLCVMCFAETHELTKLTRTGAWDYFIRARNLCNSWRTNSGYQTIYYYDSPLCNSALLSSPNAPRGVLICYYTALLAVRHTRARVLALRIVHVLTSRCSSTSLFAVQFAVLFCSFRVSPIYIVHSNSDQYSGPLYWITFFNRHSTLIFH